MGLKILRPADRWAKFSVNDWMHACRQAGHGVQDERLLPLLDWLYDQFPQPGAPSHGAIPVILAPGKAIASHAHPEHTIVYYPFMHETRLITKDEEYWPAANTAVYLPPLTEHRVEKNRTQTPRLSVALRWKEPPNRLRSID